MILNSIKRIWKNPDHRTVISNTLSLSGLQVANTLLPLITVPYVVRVIGPANYGLIAFAQAFVTYFVLLVNYGFDLSASREIAQVRDDNSKLNEVFWSVLWTKSFLFLVSTLMFAVALTTIPQLRANRQVFMASYLVLVGYVAFPTWLFQGMEKLGMTAILNFIVKLAFTVGIFAFLRDRNQYIVVPLLSSGGQILAGGLAVIYATRKLVPDFKGPKISKIIGELKQGWTVFVSTVFINFYTASNTVILGFFAAQEDVGYFTGGLKIVLAIQALVLYPLVQAAYPHIGKLMKEQREKGLAYIKKMSLVIVAVTIPVSVGLLVLAPFIVRIVLGPEFVPSVYVLRILSPFPVVIGLSNVWGIQGVLNLNEDRAFLRTIIVGSVLNLVLNLTLAGPLKEVGTSLSWLFTEIYITTAFFFVMRRSGIELFDIAFYKNWIHSGLVSREV